MLNQVGKWIRGITQDLRDFTDYSDSPQRYRRLRRNMILLGLLGTMVPLFLMAVLNYHQYQRALKAEVLQPMRILVNRTKHSFELFLIERLSAVSFIASAYSPQDLSDERTLNRIFQVMKREFGGFVDLGLIDPSGLQVSYVGPYELKGKNYADQDWFQEVKIQGTYISDVFMGYRKFPHFVIAVETTTDAGKSWTLRATIDTDKFNNLIASMGLEGTTDAFVINRYAVLQTPSKFYGKVLDLCPFPVPSVSYVPNVLEAVDPQGKHVIVAYIHSDFPSFVLMVVKPRGDMLRPWYALQSELFVLFAVSVLAIALVLFKLTDLLVKRIQTADERREISHREVQYTSKLASIGRLAAGVAHEINNPIAIINEKAGLMTDLIEKVADFPNREKFLALTGSIAQSVDRVRNITHRLLGFARRMDVQFEELSLNEVLEEVLSFLEKEAFHRNIEVQLDLSDELPRISSDRGQLQQVFLNILNNAFDAVEDGGRVVIRSFVADAATVGVSVQDDGKGMSEETRAHIFDPFFTTKKGYGTGLGLSITYGIVTKLGGRIDVESAPGQGATFTVILPQNTGNPAGG
jgi:two-component system, NtrC family, sensor kinase